MNSTNQDKTFSKSIIRKCHCCGQVTESQKEASKCLKCNKSFLPLNYFQKVHGNKDNNFKDLFDDSYELHEDELIKGLFVLW